MLKSFIKALAIVAGLVMPSLAWAVGMGGINLTSALGEPLKLEVELDTASKAETNNLSVRLASPEMFKSAGLDYPYGLPKLKLKIETNPSNDRPYLIITSLQPINEPFVSLLVELSWPSGKLLREYTFLLDPPGYAADQPKAAEVKPVEPIAQLAPEISTAPETSAVPEMDVGSEMSAGEAAASGVMAAETDALATEEKIPGETSLDTAEADQATAKDPMSSGIITVKRGDTLHRIASLAKPSDVSVERMLVALYRVNAEKFNGKNMNRLQAGKILRMPDQSDLDQLTQAQAVKEIRTQVVDWHAYRQRLAAASVAVTEQTPTQEASGKISASVTDQTPPAKESAKEVVRLSKGEAPGDHAAGGGKAKDSPDNMHSQEEEAIAKGKTLAENKDRAALLEKNVKDMQRLLELKNQAAAPKTKADTAKLEVLPQATPPVVAPDTEQPAKPVAQATTEPVQPSLLDEILGEPLYRIATVVLLGLVVLGVVLRLRAKRRKRRMFEGDEGNAAGRITAPIAPSPETGDFTVARVDVAASRSGATAGNGNSQIEEVDPISEADLFLNFGRDEQAEEILKDALIKNPAHHQVHLKLLSIYLNRRDVTAFSAIAQRLKDSGDAKSWEQASIMGLKLEPNNPMYGGDGRAAAVVQPAASQVISKPSPEVMFDVGAAEAQSPLMDFDLGLATTKVAAVNKEQSYDSTLVLNAPMDFDVTGSRPVAAVQSVVSAETSARELDDLIFDVTAGVAPAPSTTEIAPKMAAPAEADLGLTFTLDIPAANKIEAAPTQAAAKPMMDFDLAEISLNLAQPAKPDSLSPPTADGKDEHWHDVATKLDLANAYKEMGDVAGAREILDEVVQEGDEQQRAAAEVLLKQL